ncbi:MAG: SDR family oxidoreductase [Acidimicrobiales bacterium]|nr:SDR family oxidoreductase [Acidimicrobiales bacterium]
MAVGELFDLDGQVAVVTGASRGIGRGIAELLADAGAKVVVASRTLADCEAVVEAIADAGGTAVAQAVDVTDEDAVEALAQRAVDAFGSLSIWVNNAGGSPGRMPLTELPRADWEFTVALNLTSVYLGARAAAKHMTAGSIVNISSRSSWGAVPNNGHYAATKAGVNVLTSTLAHEMGPDIRVNAVAPGAVPTDIFFEVMKMTPEDLPQYARDTGVPLERLGTPTDIAAAVLYLVAPASGWVTGELITVSGGR